MMTGNYTTNNVGPQYTTNGAPPQQGATDRWGGAPLQPAAPGAPLPSAGQSFDWTNLVNNLGPGIIGAAGNYLSGNQLQNTTNKAVGYAGYNPTNISGPGGAVASTRNPDGSINYGLSGVGTPAMNGLSQFATNAAGAGSNVLGAFNNFNPQQFAQTNYDQLAALQAPKNTDQTQQMLNYEQESGRGGLTQNGQLGDLGGLALAQNLGDTNLRMQAEQLASQRQSQLAQTAGSLGTSGTNALGGVSNYNDSLMNMLRTAMQGSSGAAAAGANQANLINQTGQIRAGQTAAGVSSALQGLSNAGGGLGNIFKSLYGSFGGGNGSGGGTDAYGNPVNSSGGLYAPNTTSDQYANVDTSGQTQAGTDTGDGSGYGDSGGFTPASGGAAGGMTASNPQSTNNGQFAGFSTVGNNGITDPGMTPTNAAGQIGMPGMSDVSSGSSSPSIGQIGGGAVDALNIGQGLQRGGLSGYGSAAVNAGKLYGAATNTPTSPGISGLGNALGIYNGIRQGGVMGYGGAAANAASMYSNLSNLSTAAGGAGFAGAGAAGAAAGYIAAPLAIYNAVANYKSGSTGADAINGAEAGAAVGSMIVPGIGTIVGGIIGGAAGAVASAFGGGTDSQEAQLAQHYTAAFDKVPPAQQQQMAAAMGPPQNVQYLQGLMNAHDGAAGHESDLQGAFGKNNVAGFTTGMTTTINQALSSGKLPPNATPQQIYSQIVQPWLASKAGGATSGNNIKGNATSSAEQAAVIGLIGQWQSGQLTSSTKVGSGGQTINVPAWAGGQPQQSPQPSTAGSTPPQMSPGTPQGSPSPLSGLPSTYAPPSDFSGLSMIRRRNR